MGLRCVLISALSFQVASTDPFWESTDVGFEDSERDTERDKASTPMSTSRGIAGHARSNKRAHTDILSPAVPLRTELQGEKHLSNMGFRPIIEQKPYEESVDNDMDKSSKRARKGGSGFNGILSMPFALLPSVSSRSDSLGSSASSSSDDNFERRGRQDSLSSDDNFERRGQQDSSSSSASSSSGDNFERRGQQDSLSTDSLRSSSDDDERRGQQDSLSSDSLSSSDDDERRERSESISTTEDDASELLELLGPVEDNLEKPEASGDDDIFSEKPEASNDDMFKELDELEAATDYDLASSMDVLSGLDDELLGEYSSGSSDNLDDGGKSLGSHSYPNSLGRAKASRKVSFVNAAELDSEAVKLLGATLWHSNFNDVWKPNENSNQYFLILRNTFQTFTKYDLHVEMESVRYGAKGRRWRFKKPRCASMYVKSRHGLLDFRQLQLEEYVQSTAAGVARMSKTRRAKHKRDWSKLLMYLEREQCRPEFDHFLNDEVFLGRTLLSEIDHGRAHVDWLTGKHIADVDFLAGPHAK